MVNKIILQIVFTYVLLNDQSRKQLLLSGRTLAEQIIISCINVNFTAWQGVQYLASKDC